VRQHPLTNGYGYEAMKHIHFARSRSGLMNFLLRSSISLHVLKVLRKLFAVSRFANFTFGLKPLSLDYRESRWKVGIQLRVEQLGGRRMESLVAV
jgi:hypothetical protein